MTPRVSLGHAGHGNEFQVGGPATSQTVKVDALTAERLGIKVEPARRQALAIALKTTGQVEAPPENQVTVTTPIPGTITQILVRPGERVKQGQVLAMLSSPELGQLRVEAQERRIEAIAQFQEADANLKLAQNNYQRQQQIARAELEEAKATEAFAQEQYDSDQSLADQGALPRRQALASKTALTEAKAAVTRASSRLQLLEADAQLQRAIADKKLAQSQINISNDLYQARLQQLGVAPNADGLVTIKAPMSGIVGTLEAGSGESGEDAGKPVLTILDSQEVWVVAHVFEKDIDAIRVGQPVRISLNSLPERLFQGQISLINPEVQGDNRTIPVKVKLANPDGLFKPGLFANLEILTGQSTNSTVVIPQSAVVNTPAQKTVVFLENGDAFQPIEVRLGAQSAGLVEVSRGLFPGDRVVTQRAPQLYAESLKNPTAGDHHHEPGTEETQVVPNPLTQYWIFPAAGALALGMFWAGVTWSRRGNDDAVSSQEISPSDETNPKILPFRESSDSLPSQVQQEQ